jgi:hypothetical protein
MPGDLPEYCYIDYTLIRFPSDRLTIGTIRRLHPDYFDVEFAPFESALAIAPNEDCVEPDEPEIGQMLWIERKLAQNAYEEVRRVFTRSNVVGGRDKPAFLDDLIRFYVRYGLASGRESALQMIRDIETQAASQATGTDQGRS